MYCHYKYDPLIVEIDKDTVEDFVGPFARGPFFPFLSSICLGLGSPTVLYLLTQLKKQSVDRLQPALFFADAATEERKGIALRRGETGEERNE